MLGQTIPISLAVPPPDARPDLVGFLQHNDDPQSELPWFAMFYTSHPTSVLVDFTHWLQSLRDRWEIGDREGWQRTDAIPGVCFYNLYAGPTPAVPDTIPAEWSAP